jgi:hypothetical protein
MANGFVPYLLKQAKEVLLNATPSKKITPVGFTQMLLMNDRPSVIESSISDSGSGHVRDMKIKYRPRLSTGKTVDTPNCDIDIIPSYLEATIPALLYRKISVHLDDAVIAQYEREASAAHSAGRPAFDVPQELWDIVIENANGLLADINIDLLAAQAAAFGKNQTNGLTTAKTVNFLKDATQNDMATGFTLLMADAMANEINLMNCMIAGSGLINNYYLQQPSKGLDNAGVNTAQQPRPKFFYDPYAEAGWGSNEFGIFEKNAVQLINVNRYSGFRAKQVGPDVYGTLPLPLVDSLGNSLGGFNFDFHLQWVNCPTTVVIGGENTSIAEGWVLHLSANYNLFNVPTDAYAADDRLTGNNGSLLYVATNA